MSATRPPTTICVIECRGQGRQRGLAHGEELRPVIRESLERWREALHTSGVSSTETFVDRFLTTTSFIDTCRRETPDLLDEVAGIAAGASASERELLAYNFMDEQWWFLPSLVQEPPACSVIGWQREGSPPLLAQNMDLPSHYDRAQAVLRVVAPRRPEAFVVTAAGSVGLAGINGVGVAVCVNALLMLRASPSGLPVAFVVRRLLEETSAPAAARVLGSVPHASGQHYAIADSQTIVSCECSRGGAAVAPGRRRVLAHTNHPLLDTDVDEHAQLRLTRRGSIRTSQRRLAFLRSQAVMPDGRARAKRLLADRSVPVALHATAPDRSMTFASMVFELTVPPRVEICPGPPDLGGWTRLAWSDASSSADDTAA